MISFAISYGVELCREQGLQEVIYIMFIKRERLMSDKAAAEGEILSVEMSHKFHVFMCYLLFHGHTFEFCNWFSGLS